MPLDVLSTFFIKPRSKKNKLERTIVRGNEVALEDILNFMNGEGKNKQFSPYYEVSDFGSVRLRGLDQNDFYVAVDGNEIVGVVAKWDQELFKQTRVVGYDRAE